MNLLRMFCLLSSNSIIIIIIIIITVIINKAGIGQFIRRRFLVNGARRCSNNTSERGDLVLICVWCESSFLGLNTACLFVFMVISKKLCY